MRWILCAAFAVLSTVALAPPANAAQPLRAYELTVPPGGLETLARAGYDVSEGRDGSRLTVTATPAQAGALRKQGFDPRPQGLPARGAAKIAEDYGPSGGYRVFRPYDRPAFDLSGDPVENLTQEMRRLARENPGIVKLVKIGETAGGPAFTDDDPNTVPNPDYDLPKPIWAVKVSRDARSEPDGSKPAVLYSSTQHAREWLSTETNRRLMKHFINGYGDDAETTRLVNTRELWFVLVCNPGGYDYTFESPTTRLWRKNLRDNNADGKLTPIDGVDPNRNFPTNWGRDEEGSSSRPNDETFRGPAPASEPETKALDGLLRRVSFEFNNNFHTFGPLLLYPFGWQTDTRAADDPLFRTLSGSDENPAIPGFNPGVGAELYITNGDTNDHAYTAYDTLSWTPELNPGDPDVEADAGGFVYQDVEADVQREFTDQLPFSLDMARSAPDPANAVSHLGNETPDFEVSSFDVSYGDPQTVQVTAKRDLGAVTVNWQVGQGDTQTAATTEFKGGERYGSVGDVYYHRVRGEVTGAKPGDKVKVWFTAQDGARRSKAFTYQLEADSGAPVLVVNAENWSGPVPDYDPAQPTHLKAYTDSLTALGVAHDVWDIDARELTAPDALGVLSHYQAIVMFTGDDEVTRFPGQPGMSGAAKVANDTVLAIRDRLNEGGKLLLTGKQSGQQFFDAYEYPQFGEPTTTTTGFCSATETDGCIPLSNDFFQYWLGGYTYLPGGGTAIDGDGAPTNAFDVRGSGPFDGLRWSFDPAGNQAGAGTALVTSSVLEQDENFPSAGVAEYERPGAGPYSPFTGGWYAYSGMADTAYRRLSKTIDLTGKTGGRLDLQASYDIEEGYDFAFVEARTPGADDWTTLPLTSGGAEATTTDTGLSCGGDGYSWLDDHPFLTHYQTSTGDNAVPCTGTGTSGEWNGLTGNSSGWRALSADLSAYDGKQVELSITYVQDGAISGLGLFVDDLKVSAGSEVLSDTSFEADLGGWTVPGPPAGTVFNADDWERTQAGFDESPVIRTPDSLWMTFGIEGIAGAARDEVLGAALRDLGVQVGAEPTPSPSASPSPSPSPSSSPGPSPSPDPYDPPPGGDDASVTLGKGAVRVNRRRVARVRLTCRDFDGNRCRGFAQLRLRGKGIAFRRFSARTGRRSTVRLKLRRSAYRKVRRQRRPRVTYVVRAQGAPRVSARVRLRVK